MAEMLMRKIGGMFYPVGEESKAAGKKIAVGKLMRCELKAERAGTVPMLRTWMGWMRETADFMAAQGCTMPLYFDSQGVPHGTRRFKTEDAHELFTVKWLGVDEHGRRYSWSLSKIEDVTVAPKWRRLHAMDRHVQWAAERGINITIPRNGEYAEGMREQEQ